MTRDDAEDFKAGAMEELKLLIEMGVFRMVPQSVVPDAKGMTVVAVHVDDMISAHSDDDEGDRFQSELESVWRISVLGVPRFALGIAIIHDPPNRLIRISQTALIDRIVAQFGLTDADSVSTPMAHSACLTRPTPDKTISTEETTQLAKIPYHTLIGILMYLVSGMHPNIAFTLSKLACFLNCYQEIHWHAALRIVRYLKGT